MKRVLASTLLATLLVVATGCASGGAVGPSDEPKATSPTSASEISDRQQQLAAYVDELMEKAAEAELWITPTLQFLTQRRGGRLEGLEYRLKTRESLTRKVSTLAAENPDLPLEQIPIDDAVRYTVVIEDEPPGHHDDSIHEILEIMDGIGHDVTWVKNYWPRGDDYSGVNTVLTAPNGTVWELQFHTPASLQTKDETHVYYEEYRLLATPIERKRELFQVMADLWETVPIPVGILQPGSLHPAEEILQHSPP